MRTAQRAMLDRMPYVVAAVVAALAAVAGWLARPVRPDPAERADLAEAVAAVDRELAANLELMSLFDQTKQAVVLENGQFGLHRATLERAAPEVSGPVADLYSRIPDTETAMERRGPANSVREPDRRVIEAWEGDARAAQRALRGSLVRPALFGWRAAVARLRGRGAQR
jgi:hypothetical protein